MTEAVGVRREVTVRASPSLALIKYWGKQDSSMNTPATSSLGVTLSGLETVTTVGMIPVGADAAPKQSGDEVVLDGKKQEPGRFGGFFDAVREVTGCSGSFRVRSRNSFPTAAGIASSSSGFAALARGCVELSGLMLGDEEVSSLARRGSASAARAVFGGFVGLEAGSSSAHQLFPEQHWPELRVLVVAVQSGPKAVSSRTAMERARVESPFYQAWVASSEPLYKKAIEAVATRNLALLGTLMRQSYLRMFSTMFSSEPPIIYWLPGSLELIRECERMRQEGLGVWETMDAGPQVKLVCLAHELDEVMRRIRLLHDRWELYVGSPGPAPRVDA